MPSFASIAVALSGFRFTWRVPGCGYTADLARDGQASLYVALSRGYAAIVHRPSLVPDERRQPLPFG